MKTNDFEIGDQVVFGTRSYSCDDFTNFKAGRVIDMAGKLIEVEFRSFFGFYRRKWMPSRSDTYFSIQRKERAEELLAKYKAD